MLRATEKITAHCCRLSVEDTKDEKKNGKDDPSNSIQHQQTMLLSYAKSNHFPKPTVFIDGGYGGAALTAPVFRKCLRKSRLAEWVRSSPKTCPDLAEILR